MGFLTLGRRFLNNIHDITDDRIDVVTRGMLGLTVACARCHDHKYDPIPTKDYYGLYGDFHQLDGAEGIAAAGRTGRRRRSMPHSRRRWRNWKKRSSEYQTKYKKELSEKNRKYRDELTALEKKVDAFKANSPAAPPRGMVMVDGPSRAMPASCLRGNPEHAGADRAAAVPADS